jgi:glycosyltransferase involved in cell wall biosynthesis
VTAARVVALVAAHDEAEWIAATVTGLGSLPALTEVVVVDDGSDDATASAALAAGASVLRVRRRLGKGRALEGALRRLPPADVWVLADGDLGASARGLAVVVSEVLEGRADMAIAMLPPVQDGGFGLVKRTAGRAIRALSGLEARQPLSGQRVLTGDVLAACRPLARGFGVETALTIDAARRGFRIVEIETDLRHRPAGRDLRGFAHRGRQGLDILLALVPRALGLR